MGLEQWWNDTDRGKVKYWEKYLSNCKYLYCRSHVVWPGMELRLL